MHTSAACAVADQPIKSQLDPIRAPNRSKLPRGIQESHLPDLVTLQLYDLS
jgi:hypothetical protein